MKLVKRGMIWVSLDPRPIDEPDLAPEYSPGVRLDGSCDGCGRAIAKRSRQCRLCYDVDRGVGLGHRRESPDSAVVALVAVFERNFASIQPWRGVLCVDCGCLCKPNEPCPSCLLWAELDAARASWSSVMAEVWP